MAVRVPAVMATNVPPETVNGAPLSDEQLTTRVTGAVVDDTTPSRDTVAWPGTLLKVVPILALTVTLVRSISLMMNCWLDRMQVIFPLDRLELLTPNLACATYMPAGSVNDMTDVEAPTVTLRFRLRV